MAPEPEILLRVTAVGPPSFSPEFRRTHQKGTEMITEFYLPFLFCFLFGQKKKPIPYLSHAAGRPAV